jgi:hypothetical protein
MKRQWKFRSINLFSLVAVAFLITGCDDTAEEAREKQLENYAKAQGVDADIDYDSEKGVQSITINTAEGNMTTQVGAALKLPDRFPDDVAIPAGMELITTSDVPDGHYVQGQSTENADTITEFFAREMKGKGWSYTNEAPVQLPNLRVLEFTKDNRRTNIAIVPGEPNTMVQITVAAAQ